MKGYEATSEDFISVMQAIAENEKHVYESNQEELAKHPEKVVTSVSNNDWLESLRTTIREALSRYNCC